MGRKKTEILTGYKATDKSDIRKEFSDTIYPTMVIRSQAETIELQDKEIERLNNIINGLEKTLKEEVKGLYNEENPMLLDETYIKYATERKMAYMYILDKLNELKGDNK